MTAFISDELFHFVGRKTPNDHELNFATLCSVLEGRTISHAPHDGSNGKTSYVVDLAGSLDSETLILPTVTYYCDIPRAALPIHTRKYGEFGLSLSRHQLIQYGARPVTYIPKRHDDWGGALSGTNILSALEATYRGLVGHLASAAAECSNGTHPTHVPGSAAETVRHLKRTLEKDVLAFIKPYDSMLDDYEDNYFYAEREWRKYGNMKFQPSDVLAVVVNYEFLDRAREAFPAYAEKIWSPG